MILTILFKKEPACQNLLLQALFDDRYVVGEKNCCTTGDLISPAQDVDVVVILHVYGTLRIENWGAPWFKLVVESGLKKVLLECSERKGSFIKRSFLDFN